MAEHIGGQALIEGVMMRNGDRISSSVISDDTIKVRSYRFTPLAKKNRVFGLPFIRGIFSLLEMLYLGMKEMTWSANESQGVKGEKLKTSEIVMSIVLSLIFAIFLFKAVPLGLTKLMGGSVNESPFLFNLTDGLLRIAMFSLYIWVISLIPDIKRVFQYHGAEHKAVNAHEHGEKLTIKNVRKYSTVHTRCGTSFLFITLILAILIFSIVPIELPFLLLLFIRLPLILPIAGISYEVLKLSSKFEGNIVLKVLTYPGLLFQKVTTKEPDDRQIEVAIAALKGALDE